MHKCDNCNATSAALVVMDCCGSKICDMCSLNALDFDDEVFTFSAGVRLKERTIIRGDGFVCPICGQKRATYKMPAYVDENTPKPPVKEPNSTWDEAVDAAERLEDLE